QHLGQFPTLCQTLLISTQLLLVGQIAVEDQIGHFLEDAVCCEVLYVIAAVGEASAFITNSTQCCLAGYLSAQTSAAELLVNHLECLPVARCSVAPWFSVSCLEN